MSLWCCCWRQVGNIARPTFIASLLIQLVLISITHLNQFAANAQSTRRPIQAAQACNGSTLVLSCPRGESIRIWQYGYVPPEVDCSKELDYNFEIGKDSVSYYSNRFVSVAKNAEPNLHMLVRACNGQQRCKLFVKISHPSMTTVNLASSSLANSSFAGSHGSSDVYYADGSSPPSSSPRQPVYSSNGKDEPLNYDGFTYSTRQPGIRVLFSCELVQNYGIPSVRSICDRFEFATSGRFHLRSPGYPASAHRHAAFGRRSQVKTTCSCELRSSYGFNLVVIEMELANGSRSGFNPQAPHDQQQLTNRPQFSREPGECPSVMRFWNSSGHVGQLPCVFEPKLRINWHDVIKQPRMGMSIEFTADSNDLMTRFWFEIQPRRSVTCPVFGCSLHECSGDADCHNPQHSCCCDPTVGLRVCKPFSPYDRVEQGILNVSCNKMVYSESDPQKPPMEGFEPAIDDVSDSMAGGRNITSNKSDQMPTDDVLLGVVIGCGLFFIFMLLGASVFVYCYCRAQRSAGTLGVRPRLSKIGDQWVTSPGNDGGANAGSGRGLQSGGMGGGGATGVSGGGYLLKNNKQTIDAKKGSHATPKSSPKHKLPVLSGKASKKASFDGESSFVDFEHDSIRNTSKEQSVESRHVVGECLLKIPEDRLRLLGNSNVTSLVCEQVTVSRDITVVTVPIGANSQDQAAAIAMNDRLLEACTPSFSSLNHQQQSAESPSVLASHDGADERQPQLSMPGHIVPDDQQFDQEPNSVTFENISESGRLAIIHGTRTSSSPSSPSSSSISSGCSSPRTSSIIYETLLINPPLSLAAKPTTQQNFSHNNAVYHPMMNATNYNAINNSHHNLRNYDSRSTPISQLPHQRFQMPRMPPQNKRINGNKPGSAATATAADNKNTKNNSNNNAPGSSNGNNGTQPPINASPSKDSLSSVSGIIKLDIISAF